MGVREHFDHLFGPDLVNAFKEGPAYYERAFELAGLDAERCLIVDDSPQALGWAAKAGARTLLVNRTGAAADGYTGPAITGLSSLAAAAEAMDG